MKKNCAVKALAWGPPVPWWSFLPIWPRRPHRRLPRGLGRVHLLRLLLHLPERLRLCHHLALITGQPLEHLQQPRFHADAGLDPFDEQLRFVDHGTYVPWYIPDVNRLPPDRCAEATPADGLPPASP